MRDPNIWTALFSFLGSVMVGLFGLIKAYFFSKDKSDLKKAKLDASIERLKADNTIKLIEYLKETVDKIKPLVEHHERVVSGLNGTILKFEKGEMYLTDMMLSLKIQYDNFNSRMDKVVAGGDLITDKIKKLESDVSFLKSGNVFVKNKK